MATHNVQAEQQAVDDDNYQQYGVNDSEVPPPTNDDPYGGQQPAEDLDQQPVDQYADG